MLTLTWLEVYFSGCCSSTVRTTTHDSSEENNSISMFSVMITIAAFLSVLILVHLFLLFLRFLLVSLDPGDTSGADEMKVSQTAKVSLVQAVIFQSLEP